MPLDREEYVEQAYLFRALSERLHQNIATQDLLASVREEILSTTKLPLAIDFMTSELKLNGVFSTAMAKLSHYFTPFQTFVIAQAESERGRFDFAAAVEILHREAEYRAKEPSAQGMFLYQFETLSRNRLRYDHGLDAMAGDPLYNEDWRQWLQIVRSQVGLVDLADMIYVRSEYYLRQRRREGYSDEPEKPMLFGEKEGKIALAHRRKDPLWFFAALQRHLGYPAVVRPKPPKDERLVLDSLARRLERLETRIKLLEEEQRGGIDLSKFYPPPGGLERDEE
jgi:hypothetical protein